MLSIVIGKKKSKPNDALSVVAGVVDEENVVDSSTHLLVMVEMVSSLWIKA